MCIHTYVLAVSVITLIITYYMINAVSVITLMIVITSFISIKYS